MNEPAPDPAVVRPAFGEAARFWLKLGFISFGGPAGQIAILHEELVERRRWVDDARFQHALNYCVLLPGPEAQQLATYLGWLFHGWRGGVLAGTLFFLPASLLLWALSWLYVTHGQIAWVAAVFYGLKPVVVALVAAAMFRLGKKSLNTPLRWALALTAFALLTFSKTPFPLIVLGAGLIGWIATKLRPSAPPPPSAPIPVLAPATPLLSRVSCLLSPLLWLAVWWVPLLALGAILGWDHAVSREGIFFSQASLVTFGGAYAVLPYVQGQAVGHFGWLTSAQFLDGLALGETTPGPLVIVLQWVGFLGGWHQPGRLAPLTAATLGAAATTWATFAPSFLWIFTGAPFIERLRHRADLTAALGAVTAAVVGVITTLAVQLAIHVARPTGGAWDWFACGLTGVAFVALTVAKLRPIPCILLGGVVGAIWQLFVVGLL
jgi:chromate transporter